LRIHRLVVHVEILVDEEGLDGLDELDGDDEGDGDNVLEED
jgi:hypothetical protein